MKTLTSTSRPFGIALAGAVLALLLASAHALVVTNTNDSGPGSLRQVIVDAASGDTITFDASLSGGTIVLTSGQLTVDKDLVIDASGLVGGLTIDGNRASRIFRFTSGTSTLMGLSIVNGQADEDDNGGGIYNSGTLMIINCAMNGNYAYWFGSGGAVFNSGSLAITNCTLEKNYASSGGGIGNGGTLTINDCILRDHHADQGGGIGNGGTLTITNSTLSGNSSPLGGGGIFNGGTLTIKNCTLCDNRVVDSFIGRAIGGGGIFNSFLGALTISNSFLSGNRADTDLDWFIVVGGGIYNHNGTLTVSNCILRDNEAGYGGAICNWELGELRVNNCNLIGNIAKFEGGGIHSSASPESCWGCNTAVSNSILLGNSAPTGGGMYGRHPGAFAFNCVMFGNSGGNWWGPSPHYVDIDVDYGSGHPEYPNITSDPLLVAPDFHLQPNSPCIDAGYAGQPSLPLYLTEGTPLDDIEGIPRPLDGDNDGIARIDIGAHEFFNPDADSDCDGLEDGMERDTLGTNPTLINTDGDPRNDYAEWLADTDGTDPSDWFQITASAQGPWMAICFHTSPNRHYTLRCCPDLRDGTWADVQGLVRIRGKGGLHTFFVRKPASPACFYRVEPGMP